MKKEALLLFLMLASCVPPPKKSPPRQPDPHCAAACVRRSELADQCGYKKEIGVEECTRRCERIETLRPGVSGASCVAVALSCEDVKECSR